MKKQIIILFSFCTFAAMGQNTSTKVKEYMQVFTTYPFSEPNPVPLLTPVYPYFRFDGFTDKSVQKEWKVVELENDYIKLIILPEIGGKIWAATEKSTGRPFLYYNHVVKFRDVAMRGPWTSGGLEANFGIMGHTPNCATPVDYKINTNDDGSITCTVGTLDLLTRTTWRMEINLPKDKAYFTTHSFWYNGTDIEQPYYHWMNAGLPVKGNLEFLYPGTKYIGHDGEYAEWPVNKENGKKINFYKENNFGGYKSYHVFGTYSHFAGAYYHDYDFGTIRYGSRDGKAGKKLWIWGLSRQGMIWEDLMTDTDGQYFELQSGRLFNQNGQKSAFTPFKQKSFSPYATDEWTEYWYPILGSNGAVEANEYGALNLNYEDGWLRIYFSPAQNINDVLTIKSGEQTIYNKTLNLKTLQVFKDSVRTSAPTADWKAVLGNQKLVYSFNGKENEMSRPVDTPTDFDWESTQGLYLLGKSEMAQKLFPQAETHLQAALQKEHNFFPALVQMSELMYRNMRYVDALVYATRAISIDAHAGDANYFYGLINEALGKMADAKDGLDLATLSVEYRSAAYTALAKIYLQEKNLDNALSFAQKALDFNRFNITALQYQAVIYRLQNNTTKSNEVLNTIASFDKISHFVDFENYLKNPTKENMTNFTSQIRNELPRETYIELGVFYYNSGCKEEAEKLFELSPSSPEATFWISYLQGKPIDFSKINLALSFPFRSETGKMIEAILKNKNNWKLKYQLALIYANRNRMEECKKLLGSCGNEPDFAPFYAMSATVNKEGKSQENITYLKKALSLDGHWRYVKLLVDYFNSISQPENALPVVEKYYLGDPSQYVIGLLYAKTLLLNKKYSIADKVLEKLKLIPFEGATEARDIYREVKLMEALEMMHEKKYTKALPFIQQAKLYPDHLGTGKSYENEIDFRIEDWLNYCCYSQMNKKKEAIEALQRIVDYIPHPATMGGNYSIANNLLTEWAFDNLGNQDNKMEWMNKYVKNSYQLQSWNQASLDKKKIDFSTVEKSVSLRLLEILVNSFGSASF